MYCRIVCNSQLMKIDELKKQVIDEICGGPKKSMLTAFMAFLCRRNV